MAENIKIEELDGTHTPLDVMMENLEQCVIKMETGDLTLEQSFDAFKAGMELVKKCNESIDAVEKEVMKLSDDGTVSPLD